MSVVEFWLVVGSVWLSGVVVAMAHWLEVRAQIRRERREAHERWRQIVRADFAQIRREMDEAMADDPTTTATRPVGGEDE